MKIQQKQQGIGRVTASHSSRNVLKLNSLSVEKKVKEPLKREKKAKFVVIQIEGSKSKDTKKKEKVS